MKVLVLGGYGHFGSVIARKLAGDAAFEVVVAGRNAERAERFAREIGVTGACLDRDAPEFARGLQRNAPELVISTAGPFQGQDYRVALAAIDAGAHYIDIADGREFVCGIVALDPKARAKGVLVASGASSVPALSAAVVDRLAPEFATLREIEAGISSSERTPGLATVRAVLGNCGRPIPQWRGGTWSTTHGWQGLRRHEFRGRPRMARWLCDCDVPDVSLFPARYSSVSSVRFGAGVELSIAHLGLWMLSGLRRLGLAPDLRPLAGPLMHAAGALRFMGSGRSAMFVRLRGTARDGREMTRDWELVAEGNDGMNVPCMAAVALARKLAGGLAATGAMPCVGLVSLEEYLAELAGLKVKVTSATAADAPLKKPPP